MRILFVQLPLLDHSYSYLLGNVEYAPSALAAYLHFRVDPSIRCETLPSAISNFASNRVITEYIASINPDMLCFTCYLWNIERNITLAREVKRLCPNTMIVMGGPEIHESSWALTGRNGSVSCFFSGEGEWFFQKYFSGTSLDPYTRSINGNALIVQPHDQSLRAEDIIEPFTSGYLNPVADGSIFLEMTRGCPYRCSYCYYSKNCPTIREQPFSTLLDAIALRHTWDLSEIYILSPTFNKTAHFLDKLDRLAALDHGIRLHTELRADGINSALAKKIYTAGFKSLEVGLQTLTPEALQRTGRNTSIEKELAGMRALHDAGIDLKIGIIPGLPGDSPESFSNTIDTLANLGFAGSIEYYPLIVLPGTRIRETAIQEEAHFQPNPPYYFTEGWGFDFYSLRDLTRHIEQTTGLTHVVRSLPDFTKSKKGMLCRGVRFNGDDDHNWDAHSYSRLIQTSVFTFFIDIRNSEMISRRLNILCRALPKEDQLYNLVLFHDELFNEKTLLPVLGDTGGDSLFTRTHIFHEFRDGLIMMPYQVFSTPARYAQAVSTYGFIEPVLRISPENLQNVARLDPDSIGRMLVSREVFGIFEEYLIRYFSDRAEDCSFEESDDQRNFFEKAGLEYISFPEHYVVEV